LQYFLLCGRGFRRTETNRQKKVERKAIANLVISKFFVRQNKEQMFVVRWLAVVQFIFVVQLLLLKNVCPSQCQQFFFLYMRSYGVALETLRQQ